MVDSFQKRDRERRKRQKRQEKQDKRRDRSSEPNPAPESDNGILGTAVGDSPPDASADTIPEPGSAPLARQVLPGSDRSKPHRDGPSFPATPANTDRPEALL